MSDDPELHQDPKPTRARPRGAAPLRDVWNRRSGWVWGLVVAALLVGVWVLRSPSEDAPSPRVESQNTTSGLRKSWVPNLERRAADGVSQRRALEVRQASQRPRLRRFEGLPGAPTERSPGLSPVPRPSADAGSSGPPH